MCERRRSGSGNGTGLWGVVGATGPTGRYQFEHFGRLATPGQFRYGKLTGAKRVSRAGCQEHRDMGRAG